MEFNGLFKMWKEYSRGVARYYGGDWWGMCIEIHQDEEGWYNTSNG